MMLSSSPSMTCTLNPAWALPMEISLAGKMLSFEPTIDPTAKLQKTNESIDAALTLSIAA